MSDRPPRRPKINPVEVEGFFPAHAPDYPDGRALPLIVSVGPRYTRLQQPEVVLSIRHRTTGGSVSVLLDSDDQEALVGWLTAPGEDLRWQQAQTAGRLTWCEYEGEPAAEVKIWWRNTVTGEPTGSGRRAFLDVDALAALAEDLMAPSGLEAMTGRRPAVPS